MLRRSSAPSVKRVMIVDDHELVRRGVRAVVERMDGFIVCADAAAASSALELAAESRPDILVTDVTLPVMRGIDVIPAFRARLPDLQVVVLSMQESEEHFRDALRAGARAYVFKSDPAGQLVEALKAVARNEPYFSRPVSGSILRTCLQPPRAGAEDMLTAREREVVGLVAQGCSNKKIASVLEITVRTVATHRASAMRKVRARSAADLARYAARNHLVEL